MSDAIRVIVPAVLHCPRCGARHVDEERNGEKWQRRAHTTHRCQACGHDWDVYVSGSPPGPDRPMAEAPRDGTVVKVNYSGLLLRAFWCDELKRWVLAHPMHLESLPETTIKGWLP